MNIQGIIIFAIGVTTAIFVGSVFLFYRPEPLKKKEMPQKSMVEKEYEKRRSVKRVPEGPEKYPCGCHKYWRLQYGAKKDDTIDHVFPNQKVELKYQGYTDYMDENFQIPEWDANYYEKWLCQKHQMQWTVFYKEPKKK